MSGEGLISVRFPISLLGTFRAAASRAGIDLHTGARYLISGLNGLTPNQLAVVPEPPWELDSRRVSLYVGRTGIQTLAEFTRGTQLSVSSIFRRLVYGLLIHGSIQFVQHAGGKRLLREIAVKNALENVGSKHQEKNTCG